MQRAIQYLFGISTLEPRKYVALALIALGVLLKCLISARYARRLPAFSTYLIAACAASLLQRSPLWSLWAEVAFAVFALFAVWEGIVDVVGRCDSQEVIIGACAGLGLLAVLVAVEPRPYPMFSHPIYFLRLYGSTFFAAVLVGAESCVWTERIPVNRHNVYFSLWFLAYVGSSPQWSAIYPAAEWFWVNIAASTMQLACLVAWRWTSVGPAYAAAR